MQFKYKPELATINNRNDSEEEQISYEKKSLRSSYEMQRKKRLKY